MNIIIHSYTNKCKTVPVPPGLADFLRGTMFLYQETKTHPNMDLVVDFSQHPIHQYIIPLPKNTSPPYQDILEQQPPLEIVECFHKDSYKVLNAVNNTNLPNQPPQRVFCFQYYDEFNTTKPLPRETQTFMKSVLDFTPELKEDAEDMLYQLIPTTPQEFCVLHVRMGDHNSSQDQITIPPDLENYLTQTILPKWGNKRVLLISDSYTMKQLLSNKYNLPSTDFMPVHLGTTNRFLNPTHNYGTYDTDIGKTLIEFVMMSKATQIYMYSVYEWGSGFSYICSHIYDIPYTRICGK
jgi:hypothetical protein